jgi:hypothetical protein
MIKVNDIDTVAGDGGSPMLFCLIKLTWLYAAQ